MRRAIAWGAALSLSACSAPSVIVELPVEAGDRVVAIADVADLDTARVLLLDVGSDGRVQLDEAEGEVSAIAALRARDVLDRSGDRASLEGVTADLDGDVSGGCGCTALGLDGPQVVGPGDRCPLPASAELRATGPLSDERASLDAIRARLHLTWPGTCPCPMTERSSRNEVEVCPLGVDAERMNPDRIALRPDGTLFLASRARMVEIAPHGERFETEIVPAMSTIASVVPLPHGGALAVGDVFPGIDERSEWVYVPPRNMGPARRVAQLPREVDVHGLFVAPRGREIWLVGQRLDGGFGRRPVIARCTFPEAIERASCDALPIPDRAACPALVPPSAPHDIDQLETGELVVTTRDGGLFVVRDGVVHCPPGPQLDQQLARLDSGRPVEIDDVSTMVAVGRRVTVCATAIDLGKPVTLVATTTIGAPGTPLVWRTIQEHVPDDVAFCPPLAFQDPLDPEHAVISGDSEGHQIVFVQVSKDDDGVEIVPDTRERHHYPELDARFFRVATTSAAIALVTERGEVWTRSEPGPFARRIALPHADAPEATSILAVEGGFEIYGSGPEPLRVRVGSAPGCAGVESDPVTAAQLGDDQPQAVARLGPQVLRFVARDDRPRMIVQEGRTRVRDVEVPGDAPIVRAAEVALGRQVALIREDGSLWSTDGATFHLLDRSQQWTQLAAVPGAGWVASETTLGRLIPEPGGAALRLELDLERHMDRSEFVDRARNAPASLTGLDVSCGAPLLVGFYDPLRDTAPGGIETASAWQIDVLEGRYTWRAYEPLDPLGARPLHGQEIGPVATDREAPILVFARGQDSAGVHAPGSAVDALPFERISGWARRGGDALFGGRHLRRAVVRVAPITGER